MSTLSLGVLLALLLFLILLSGFFSSSETGMMSLNRYRLRHKAKEGHSAAMRVVELLKRPDRILGVILIGNTFANIFAAAVATMISSRLYGDVGVAIGTFLLTLIILIFSEVTPKTLAALYPERLAYATSLPLKILLKILYPLVWSVNGISNAILGIFRIKVKGKSIELLTHDELRTLINEAIGKASAEYQNMLLGILDLGGVTVEDIMVPRNEIVGIDLDNSWDEILNLLTNSEHTRLPIYHDSVEHISGMLHLRKVLPYMSREDFNKEQLIAAADKVYFIPEATPLNKLLPKMRKHKERIGLVVDEYGEIQGLATLDDILEEIVGEFTTDFARTIEEVFPQKDGSFEVDGGVNLRELNRDLGWSLPTGGPKTMSGLIVEYLETIPASKCCIRIGGYPIEIISIESNMIKTVRIWPENKS